VGVSLNTEDNWSIVEPGHVPHKEIHRVPANLDGFWVITVLSNPVRYKGRYELYWKFKEMCQHAGVKLITVEQAFGNRPFMVTNSGNPFHLQVRSVEELWHKENMINMGIRHAAAVGAAKGIPVREVAWVDADCRSSRTPRDWFEETWHQLQHYQFVQMWENLIDLDINFNPIGEAQPSFMANYVKYGTPNPEAFHAIEAKNNEDYPYSSKIFGRPGLAWAANVEALNQVGGLIDCAILGAGDWYMAHGLVGSLISARSEYAEGPYMSKMLEWQSRAQRWIKRDVGFVSGVVYHDFHGRKALRFYGSRGKILSECKYNPETDIKYDQHGMLQLETWDDRQIKLRDQIRGYFRARSEDSIDL
jgi:hypothetical protein